jgi:hypothetical protein
MLRLWTRWLERSRFRQGSRALTLVALLALAGCANCHLKLDTDTDDDEEDGFLGVQCDF